MRITRIIFLFLSLSVILTHSVSPHHHHQEQDLAVDGDHDHDDSHDHHDDSDGHDHGTFTYIQIGNTFLTGKQLIFPSTLTPVIEIFNWSFIFPVEQEPDDFYIKDIDIPPLLRCLYIPFRGPPSF